MGPGSSKKRKRSDHPDSKSSVNGNGVDTSKPTAVFKPGKGRDYTVSIALPGSIIANAQSHELKTALAGQIARALAVFCVDEVVVFDDGQGKKQGRGDHWTGSSDPDGATYTGYSDPDHFLIHLLSYLETPPHLRKHLFPMHPNLRTAGTLPSLDMPHHLRADEWCQYREGVTIGPGPPASGVEDDERVTSERRKKKKKKHADQERAETAQVEETSTTLVEAGLPAKVVVPASIPENTRLTLKFPTSTPPLDISKGIHSTNVDGYIEAEPVGPSIPREETGYYWGYSIRRAPSLSTVFTECEYDGGYDLSFGTSERGSPISELLGTSENAEKRIITSFKHLLVVFGGVAGLEVAMKADEELQKLPLDDPSGLFDAWVNVLPGQGSRTIRTEEAVWCTLMALRPMVVQNDA